MAETGAETEGGGAAAGTGSAKKKLPGKVLVLYVGAPLLVLALALGGAFAFGLIGGAAPEEETVAEADGAPTDRLDPRDVIYVELPELLVNLNAAEGKASFLKLKVALEVHKSADVTALDAVMPRIVDKFQVYLRELRLEDLDGSAGTFRLKEELLRRVNAAVHPMEVQDVLFKEMIIQ